jgi:multiple sugar transport system substrate-binding protein
MRATIRHWSLALLVMLFAGILAACGGGGTGGTGETGGGTGAEGGAATTVPEESGQPGAQATQAPGAQATPVGGEATGGDTGTTGGDGATGGAAALPAECSNVALQFWNPFTGPDGPYMGQLVDQFNQANPNIQVQMTSQAEYYTQLGTAAASNTLPEVAVIHADQIATQVFRNVLRPMDDVTQQLGLSGDNFPEAVWQAGEVNGQRYAVPLDIHPMTMFYNADMLQQAGLSGPPTNSAEFAQAAQAMTANGNNGFMLTTGFPVRQIFEMLLYQYGGESFGDDGASATWNSEAGVKALTLMKELQDQYSQPNLEVDAELNAFKTGTVGMVWNGIWQITNLTGEGVEFNGMATAVPQMGEQPAVWAGSHQLALTAQASPDPCKDAAAGIFMRYLLDNSLEWARAGQIPASNEVRESAEFQALEPQNSIAPSVENAFFPPSVPGITDAYAPLDEAVSAVMAGTTTDVKAALDDAATRADQILEQNRQNYGDAPAGQ